MFYTDSNNRYSKCSSDTVQSNDKPVDTVPVDTVPVDTAPVDTVPVDTVPVDTAPVDTIPVDTVPVDTVPVDTVPVDTVKSDDVQNNVQNNTLKFLNFIKKSELYIVSVDGSPKFYVNSEKAANDKMWDVTRLLSSKYVFDGYRTQFIKVNNNELHIIGSYRFFIIAYDQILNRITFDKISQCM